MDFRLADSSIDPAAVTAALADRRAGACCTFDGRVRDLNEGRAVTALEYEAFEALAEKEGGRIVSEARSRFPIIGAACAHRTGRLVPGEIAVFVAVTAEHRGDAFSACRYIIDEVKQRLPVWKKEHYRDGSAEWINCAARGPGAGLKAPVK